MVDVDSNQRRTSRLRRYLPTIAEAHSLACSVLEPTVALDTGGGVACAYLPAEPMWIEDAADVAAIRRLARRFTRAFAAAVASRGRFDFDSPPGATSWIRPPGVKTAYDSAAEVPPRYDDLEPDGDHVVTVLSHGPRPTWDDLVEIGRGQPEHFDWHYGGETWDAKPVPVHLGPRHLRR
jgi:hypothetical protein